MAYVYSKAKPERVAYIYHFYDPVAKRFVYTGQSEMSGSNVREANHVNDSKKSNVTLEVIFSYIYLLLFFV